MKKRKGKTTIFERIFFPLVFAALIQVVLLYGVFWMNGIFQSFDENAKELLKENVRNKYQMLQSDMVETWSSFGNLDKTILQIAEQELLAENKSWDDIRSDAALNEAIIQKSAKELISRLRKNKTTGIFLVLDGAGVEGDEESYAGIYIRNRDPATETSDNSDLGILRGLPPVSRELGISLESFWQSTFRFEGGRDNPDNDYFYFPIDAARKLGMKESKNCCYWSHPFRIGSGKEVSVITYTIPLFNSDGDVYGVLGVELNTNYLTSQIYSAQNDGGLNRYYYIGVTTDDGNTYQKMVSSDAKYQMEELDAETKSNGQESWMITAQTKQYGGNNLYGYVFPLKLYNNNAPHSEEQWVLIGFQEESVLYRAGNEFKKLMALGLLMILILDILVALGSSIKIVQPVRMFAKKLKDNREYEELSIPETKISELDALSNAIITMNHDIIESAKRTSKLIELSGMPVGVYEKKTNSNACYCSDGFFKVLDCEEEKTVNNLLPAEQLDVILEKVMNEPAADDIYKIEIQNKTKIRYIKIISQSDEVGTIGTIMDVTKEVEDRSRIEHDRDYDTLTGIWNRRAFENRMERLFKGEREKLGIAAMVMFDLDNLKSINDAYGHDCGDMYIRAFAEALGQFISSHTFVARRSGDEFYILFYGFQTEAQVREKIAECWKWVTSQSLVMLDNVEWKIRVSAGCAWYPQDSLDYQKLIHYADFAMYYSKNTQKGSLQEFNIREYKQESFLFNGHEALNRLIDYELVNYMFQPIVSAKTGKIYGYELLMRSLVDELKTPDTIIRMAKSQGKLNHIERITWFRGLAAAKKAIQEGTIEKDAKLFINSIANQVISQEDGDKLKNVYRELLKQLVLEVTEGENNNLEYTKQKLRFVKSIGGQIAIDDYGTGYNSELALVMIPAEIVKIDMTFVQHVDRDQDKQIIIRNLISFAQSRNIAVLAEGVETKEEMETLIRFGVDYLQGYYISRPQYTPVPNKQAEIEIQEMVKKIERTMYDTNN